MKIKELPRGLLSNPYKLRYRLMQRLPHIRLITSVATYYDEFSNGYKLVALIMFENAIYGVLSEKENNSDLKLCDIEITDSVVGVDVGDPVFHFEKYDFPKYEYDYDWRHTNVMLLLNLFNYDFSSFTDSRIVGVYSMMKDGSTVERRLDK